MTDFETRIEEVQKALGCIGLAKLNSICMELKVSEFAELERNAFILDETQNNEGKRNLVNSLLKI